MDAYHRKIFMELETWKHQMERAPSLTNRVARNLQLRLNSFIPERIHHMITRLVEKMVKTVLFGSKYTTKAPQIKETFQLREAYVKKVIRNYKRTASLEGAVTGAGGILMGFADFPAFLTIKLKMMFDIASLYGCQVKDYRERLFILYVFQLAFSSQQGRGQLFKRLEHWDVYVQTLPLDEKEFDWRGFQQEYRDYIDLAKLAQLIPVIGAAVGAVANWKLTQWLGTTAMQCYRLRYFQARSRAGDREKRNGPNQL